MEAGLRRNIERIIGRSLTEQEYDGFTSRLSEKTFRKKSLLNEAGKLCNHIYYIQKGACYSFINDEKGERHAVQFAIEDYWISDLYSFFSGRESIYTIETLEPCKVFLLSKESYQAACEQFPVFDRYFRILIQNAYVSIQYRLAKTISESAEHRYEEFSRLHPAFIQRIPQYLIASYLGVKPQSLSRIRKEIAKKA